MINFDMWWRMGGERGDWGITCYLPTVGSKFIYVAFNLHCRAERVRRRGWPTEAVETRKSSFMAAV